ncbi:UNVERIFIED_CONTAM: hypothetical protein FKN15_030360 [Acipenser sinensis]
MNTRCPLKRVPSATRFFTLCILTVQPPQSYSVGGQRSSGQLTGARPDYRGLPCIHLRATALEDHAALGNLQAGPQVPGQSTGVIGAQ